MRVFLATAIRNQFIETERTLGEIEDELVTRLTEIRSLRGAVGRVILMTPAIPEKRSEFAPPTEKPRIEEKVLTDEDISGILDIVGRDADVESTEEQRQHVTEMARTFMNPLNRGLDAMRRRLQGEDSNEAEPVQQKFGT
jgi:hypothetical protein